MKALHPKGSVRAQKMLCHVTDALDVLMAEAVQEAPRGLNIGLPLRITERLVQFTAFDGILRLLDFPRDRLWIFTRSQIARAFVTAYRAQRSATASV